MKRPHEIRAEDFSIKIQPKAKGLDEIFPLITLCASGKLYEVKEWIAEGKPINATLRMIRDGARSRRPYRRQQIEDSTA